MKLTGRLSLLSNFCWATNWITSIDVRLEVLKTVNIKVTVLRYVKLKMEVAGYFESSYVSTKLHDVVSQKMLESIYVLLFNSNRIVPISVQLH